MFQRSFAVICLLSAALVLAIWLEKTEPRTWRERLALPSFFIEENRHTPLETAGEYLPPSITASRTIAAREGPVIIAGAVEIPVGVTLTLEAGTHIRVHEYGLLRVAGSLHAVGSQANPVVFSTNETHPANRVWSGIMFAPDSTGTLSHVTIRHASPALTCEPASSVIITHSILEWGNVGIVAQSPTCSVEQTAIRHVDTGIVALVEPVIRTLTIQARNQDIQHPLQPSSETR